MASPARSANDPSDRYIPSPSSSPTSSYIPSPPSSRGSSFTATPQSSPNSSPATSPTTKANLPRSRSVKDLVEVFNATAKEANAQQAYNISPPILIPRSKTTPGSISRSPSPSAPISQHSPTRRGPIVPTLRLNQQEREEHANAVRYMPKLQLGGSNSRSSKSVDKPSEQSNPLKVESPPSTKPSKPLPQRNSPSSPLKNPMINPLSIGSISVGGKVGRSVSDKTVNNTSKPPPLQKRRETNSTLPTLTVKGQEEDKTLPLPVVMSSRSAQSSSDIAQTRERIIIFNPKSFAEIKTKYRVLPSCIILEILEKDLKNSCITEAALLISHIEKLEDLEAAKTVNAYAANTFPGRFPNLTIFFHRLGELNQDIQVLLLNIGKTHKKIAKYQLFISELLSHKNYPTKIVESFDTYFKKDRDFHKLIKLASGADSETLISLIEFLRNYSNTSVTRLREVYTELHHEEVAFRKMVNHTFEWSEPSLALYPMRNIYRQEIIRCNIPHSTVLTDITIKGFRNGKAYMGRLELGELGKTDIECQTTFFTALLDAIYKAGIAPNITEEEFRENVALLIKDRDNRTASISLFRGEKVLQMLTNKAQATCSDYIRQVLKFLNDAPYILKSVPKDSILIEIDTPDSFRVSRVTTFTRYLQDGKDPEMKKKVMEVNVLWTVSINTEVNGGLPVVKNKILNIWIDPEASLEVRLNCKKAVSQINPFTPRLLPKP